MLATWRRALPVKETYVNFGFLVGVDEWRQAFLAFFA